MLLYDCFPVTSVQTAVVKVEVLLLVSEIVYEFDEVKNNFISCVTRQFCKRDLKIINSKFSALTAPHPSY